VKSYHLPIAFPVSMRTIRLYSLIVQEQEPISIDWDETIPKTLNTPKRMITIVIHKVVLCVCMSVHQWGQLSKGIRSLSFTHFTHNLHKLWDISNSFLAVIMAQIFFFSEIDLHHNMNLSLDSDTNFDLDLNFDVDFDFHPYLAFTFPLSMIFDLRPLIIV